MFRVVGKTDTTNLRMHFHRGEFIFNWECNARELRVHDPATAQPHGLPDKGFISTNEWHEIVWEIGLRRMRVIVDGETRYDGTGDYSDIEAAPWVGPCFGSKVVVRELTIVPLGETRKSRARKGQRRRRKAGA